MHFRRRSSSPHLILALLAFAATGCGTKKVGILGPPSGSGADGSVAPGSADSGSAGDAGPCPPYQSSCNGICIPTSTDPNNCGGCGIKCGGTLACSGGTCSP